LSKGAFIFSVENKHNKAVHSDGSSTYEKMAIALVTSIREHMPNIDVYCGCFTNNRISDYAKKHFVNLNVNIIEDPIFNNVDSPLTALFLRSFTKHYFANQLLKQYDYLIYSDVDVLILKPLKFKFNPTDPFVIVDTMPEWVKNYQRQYTEIREGNLYYNWFDVINAHNAHIYDIDYNAAMLHEHMADMETSNNIDQSGLRIIDQDFGGYHCFKPVTEESLVYHYDDLGEEGSLVNIKNTHPLTYIKYRALFEHILHVPVSIKEGHWEEIMRRFS
jgi:hypothetical protein